MDFNRCLTPLSLGGDHFWGMPDVLFGYGARSFARNKRARISVQPKNLWNAPKKCVTPSGFLNESDNKRQNDRADYSDDDGVDHAALPGKADSSHDETTNNRTDNADHNI